MSSSEASKTVPVSNQIPNKRERAASQFGQLDGQDATDWASLPTSIQNAIARLAAEVATLKGSPIT